jgi:hypothetical protein
MKKLIEEKISKAELLFTEAEQSDNATKAACQQAVLSAMRELLEEVEAKERECKRKALLDFCI